MLFSMFSALARRTLNPRTSPSYQLDDEEQHKTKTEQGYAGIFGESGETLLRMTKTLFFAVASATMSPIYLTSPQLTVGPAFA